MISKHGPHSIGLVVVNSRLSLRNIWAIRLTLLIEIFTLLSNCYEMDEAIHSIIKWTSEVFSFGENEH